MDVRAVSPRLSAGALDPLLDGRQTRGQLLAPTHAGLPTTPAYRPVVPWRRWEYRVSSSRAQPGTHSRGTSSAVSCSTTPAATSMAGVPDHDRAAETGATEAASSRIAAGTS